MVPNTPRAENDQKSPGRIGLMKFARGIKMDKTSLVKRNSACFGEAGESVLKLGPIRSTINLV